MKTAGVVLDFYDDPTGSLVKEAFPTPEDLPESVKIAHVLSSEERQVLRDDAYALILHNDGSVLRKFACVDEGNTLLSCLYFEENAAFLPEEAVKVAAVNLASFCQDFGLEPTPFVKMAAEDEAPAEKSRAATRAGTAIGAVGGTLAGNAAAHHVLSGMVKSPAGQRVLKQGFRDAIKSGPGQRVALSRYLRGVSGAAKGATALAGATGLALGGHAAGKAIDAYRDRNKEAAAKDHSENAKSGMGKTRDPMHQPMVGDEADWSARTNLVSIRGGADSGRVIPTANQMKTAAAGDVNLDSHHKLNPEAKPPDEKAKRQKENIRAALRGGSIVPGAIIGGNLAAFGGDTVSDLITNRLGKSYSNRLVNAAAAAGSNRLVNAAAAAGMVAGGVGAYKGVKALQDRKDRKDAEKAKVSNMMPGMPGGTAPAPATRPAAASPMMGKQPMGGGTAPMSMPKMGSADMPGGKLTDDVRNIGVNQKNPPQQNHQKQVDKNTFAVGPGKGDLEVNYKKVANKVDVTGEEPRSYIAKMSSSRYALGDKYPLDSFQDVKAAVDYFDQNYTEMLPADRHEYCVKTASRADDLGIQVSELMERYGSQAYATDVEAHLSARKANSEKEYHELFDTLKEKRSSIEPEVFAELLADADKVSGLSWYWGGNISDPYLATFGPSVEKLANCDWAWQSRVGDRVTAEQLKKLAVNGRGMLKKHFDHHLIAGFQQDPVAVFESLPDDTKVILARLAADEFDGLQNN